MPLPPKISHLPIKTASRSTRIIISTKLIRKFGTK